MNFNEIHNHILFNDSFNHHLIINYKFSNLEYCKLFIVAFNNNRNKDFLNYLFYNISDFNIIVNNKYIFEHIIQKPYFNSFLDHIFNLDNNILLNNFEESFSNSLFNNYSKYTNIIYSSKKELLFDIIEKDNLILLLIFNKEFNILNDIYELLFVNPNKKLTILKLDKNRYYDIDVSLIPLFIEILYIPNMFSKDLINIPYSIKTIIFEDFFYIHSIKTLSTIPDTVQVIYIYIINCSNYNNYIKIYYDNITKEGTIYNKTEIINSIVIKKSNIFHFMNEFRNIWSCFHYINF